ncbi:MAG: Gfo/Idh/MocA family oxidoreductase [Methanoregulaceae archaeon]|jgi:predicted dehydrogenase
MTNRKKAAIIGFGGMGQRHYTAYSKIGVDIVAISDWEPNKVKKNLPAFNPDHIYNNHLNLLKNEKNNIDILSVVTNGPTHAKVTIDGSEAGIKNILCEKPMATNLSDARRVIEVCKKNETRLAVNHIRRWNKNYLNLKKLISENIIGEIRHLYFSCGSTGIGNFAIHFFDTARFLTASEPEWIVGFLDKTGTPNPRGIAFVDPGGYGIVKFKNGCRFFLDTSEDTGVQYSFQIVGALGRIIIDELNDTWQIWARTGPNREIPCTRYGTNMEIIPFHSTEKFDIVTLTSRAMEELLSGNPVSSTGEDGQKSLELVLGLHVSDEHMNTKVCLPLTEQNYQKDVQIA